MEVLYCQLLLFPLPYDDGARELQRNRNAKGTPYSPSPYFPAHMIRVASAASLIKAFAEKEKEDEGTEAVLSPGKRGENERLLLHGVGIR